MSYVTSRTCNCVDFSISDSYMVSGHQDGKIRLWDLSSRKVSAESGKTQQEPITGIKTYNQGVNILAVSKDHMMVKYDKRRLDDPISIF